MAKKRVTYLCDVCGLEHSTEPQANLCEKTHFKPTEITKVVYGERKAEYPESINVKLVDASGVEKVITFHR